MPAALHPRLRSVTWSLALLWGLVMPMATARAQTATGSAFAFQGQLLRGGTPASGAVDLRFLLYDDATAGSLLAQNQLSNVSVQDGIFAVSLDYGAAAFGPDARWLETQVWDIPSTSWISMLPRQRVFAVPAALYSLGPWRPVAGGVYLQGKAGINTNAPAWALDILDTQAVARLTSTTSANGSVVELKNTQANPQLLGAINFSNSNSFPGQIAYEASGEMTFRVAGNERFSIDGLGPHVPPTPRWISLGPEAFVGWGPTPAGFQGADQMDWVSFAPGNVGATAKASVQLPHDAHIVELKAIVESTAQHYGVQVVLGADDPVAQQHHVLAVVQAPYGAPGALQLSNTAIASPAWVSNSSYTYRLDARITRDSGSPPTPGPNEHIFLFAVMIRYEVSRLAP